MSLYRSLPDIETTLSECSKYYVEIIVARRKCLGQNLSDSDSSDLRPDLPLIPVWKCKFAALQLQVSDIAITYIAWVAGRVSKFMTHLSQLWQFWVIKDD